MGKNFENKPHLILGGVYFLLNKTQNRFKRNQKYDKVVEKLMNLQNPILNQMDRGNSLSYRSDSLSKLNKQDKHASFIDIRLGNKSLNESPNTSILKFSSSKDILAVPSNEYCDSMGSFESKFVLKRNKKHPKQKIGVYLNNKSTYSLSSFI